VLRRAQNDLKPASTSSTAKILVRGKLHDFSHNRGILNIQNEIIFESKSIHFVKDLILAQKSSRKSLRGIPLPFAIVTEPNHQERTVE
jgi:hypothetical protein